MRFFVRGFGCAIFYFVKKLNCICTVEKTVLIWYNDKATQSEY